jgi:antitoxin MazE
MMRAKVSKWGNSLGLRLPKAIADEAQLTEGQIVNVSVKDRVVVVEPTSPTTHYELSELLDEMERLGPEAAPPFEDFGILPSEWPQDDWSDIAPTREEMGRAKNGSRKRTGSRRR